MRHGIYLNCPLSYLLISGRWWSVALEVFYFGHFDSKSAYEIVCGRDPYEKRITWDWLWKLEAHLCVQFFLWLYCHMKVSIAEALARHVVWMFLLSVVCVTTKSNPLHTSRGSARQQCPFGTICTFQDPRRHHFLPQLKNGLGLIPRPIRSIYRISLGA